MNFPGFVGPSYTLDSVNVDCQRSVNIYPEIIESGNGKEGGKVYLKSTPGLEEVMTVGSGPIRMILRVPTTNMDPLFPKDLYLVISGNQAYTAEHTAGAWTVTLLKDGGGDPFTLSTSSGGVSGKASIASTVISSVTVYSSVAYFADGENLYVYYIDYSIGTRNDRAGVIAGLKSSHVELVDGFFVVNEVGTSKFYVSNWASPIFNPLSFASAEGDPDNIIAIIAKNRELWLLNERTIEVNYNSGNADFPFERIQGGFIEKGIVAPYSAAKIDSNVFWLGRDAFGQGVVYTAKGLAPQRISTYAVESAIAKYADISKATAYTYSDQGHSFYVLNFAEGTWVYDLSTGLWHERAFTNIDGELERHRVDCVTFLPELSIHLCGDYETNKIYKFNPAKKTDNGSPITRLRTFPHASGGLKNVFYKSLQIDMETGVGLDGDVYGSDPQMMLDWSNDGGHTWSSESWVSIGKKIGGIGDFKKRVIWRRLGMSRDRVFRIKTTDPVSITLLSAEIDFEVGAH